MAHPVAEYPPPGAFGLPYESWRPGQWELITGIMESDHQAHMLVAPTGFGKSLAYMAMSQLVGGRTVVLTATKALQDQLVRDFSAIGLFDVRGRSAYQCTLARYVPSMSHLVRPSTTAATAPCRSGFECPLKSVAGCPYFDRVRQSRSESLIVTNYDFWLYNDIGEVDLLVMDEAHQAPDELADFLSFHLTADMRRHLAGRMPEGEEVSEWREWARWMGEKVKGKIEQAHHAHNPSLQELSGGLDKIVKMLGKGEWVIERFQDGAVHFDCVNPEAFGSMLWAGAKKTVLVSATCNKMTAAAIGINDVMEWEAKSSFPVERRPVWAIDGAVQVNYRMVEGQKRQWVNCIDRIVGARSDRKGIIHTTSFERARYLLQTSSHSSRLLLNDSRNTKDVVEAFKRDTRPSILVSPSVTTGYDFPYSQCEFQVIGKIPFPDLRTKAAKVRSERQKDWAGYTAAQQMVQSSGRGMRAANDLCETFVVDGNFAWWYRTNRKWTPRWWQDAVRFAPIGSLPPPPAKIDPRALEEH